MSIYKLCCNDTNIPDIYIGSTTQFTRRKYEHKSHCNNINCKKHNSRVYKFIRENGGWSNWSMIQIEQYEATDKRDLETRERYWIEELKSTLNYMRPTRDKKEYYLDNKDKILDYQQEYRKENIDSVKEYHKEYRQKNKDKILEYQQEYRKENIDRAKEYHKDYYLNNRDKLLEKEREKQKITCECGAIVHKSSISRHIKTIKHLELLKFK